MLRCMGAALELSVGAGGNGGGCCAFGANKVFRTDR